MVLAFYNYIFIFCICLFEVCRVSIWISIKNRGYGYLVEEKDLNEKLYGLIKSIYEDKSLVKNILENQRQYSDKNIFKNINSYIKNIINEKN